MLEPVLDPKNKDSLIERAWSIRAASRKRNGVDAPKTLGMAVYALTLLKRSTLADFATLLEARHPSDMGAPHWQAFAALLKPALAGLAREFPAEAERREAVLYMLGGLHRIAKADGPFARPGASAAFSRLPSAPSASSVVQPPVPTPAAEAASSTPQTSLVAAHDATSGLLAKIKALRGAGEVNKAKQYAAELGRVPHSSQRTLAARALANWVNQNLKKERRGEDWAIELQNLAAAHGSLDSS